jgi:hypothetical protein
VLAVPRHDPGRGARLDSCTSMCGYAPSFTTQRVEQQTHENRVSENSQRGCEEIASFSRQHAAQPATAVAIVGCWLLHGC